MSTGARGSGALSSPPRSHGTYSLNFHPYRLIAIHYITLQNTEGSNKLRITDASTLIAEANYVFRVTVYLSCVTEG
jgi:hypothetical protein